MLRPLQLCYYMKYLDKDLFIDVLFEDNHLLVVDKPFNLLTQPSGTSRDNLEDRAKLYLQKKYQKEKAYLHAVHRLDKDVGGVVVFAKTSKALSRMNEQIRKREVTKIYRAVIEGRMPHKKGILENDLEHKSYRAVLKKDGKKSTLNYSVIQEEGAFSLLEIELVTGRYHQIRIQLSVCGNPIVGDTKYNSQFVKEHIFLLHTTFCCLHPTLKTKIQFQSNQKIQIPKN